MSWSAYIVYTLPEPAIIDAFKSVPGLEQYMFLVNDFRGIRHDWTQSFMLTDGPHEYSHLRHGLPPSGLLAIGPRIYETGYDRGGDKAGRGFIKNYSTGFSTCWSTIPAQNTPVSILPSRLEVNAETKQLLAFLQHLHQVTAQVLVLYYCSMWGGDVDEEYAVVFDKDMHIYWRDTETDTTWLLQGENALETEKAIEAESGPLSLSLAHLQLFLPSGFFALHQTSFDWKQYRFTK